jgi:hypothetical protein
MGSKVAIRLRPGGLVGIETGVMGFVIGAEKAARLTDRGALTL